MAESGRLADVQILRGVAVTMVLAYHLSFSTTIVREVAPSLSDPFYIGVQLFFIISGFVVTRSLLRGSVRPDVFVIRRAFRLFPPLVAALSLSALTLGIFHLFTSQKWTLDLFTVSAREFASQAAYILTGTFINYVAHPAYVNSAMWTLSVEFQFYLLVTALLAAGFVARVRKGTVTTGLLIVAATVLTASVGARILLQFGYHVPYVGYAVGFFFDFMAAGVLLAFVPDEKFLYLRRFGRGLPVVLTIVPIIMVTFCRSTLQTITGPDTLYGLGFLAVEACYVLLVACAIGGVLSASGRGRFYRLFHAMGERSYTIYIIQFACLALGWLVIASVDVSIASSPWAYAVVQPVVTLLVLVPVTEIIYRSIEMPLNRYGHRVASRITAFGRPAPARNTESAPGTPRPQAAVSQRQ